MKRFGNLFHKICSVENLQIADSIARKGKLKQYGVIVHDKNKEANILKLHDILVNKQYTTSMYSTFKVYEPKERDVFRLPYYPDRIVHHAIMLHLEKIFVSTFTADTYSCIKGRGIKGAADAVKEALKDVPGTKYCLKLDIKKFYPNVDHRTLKCLLRKKLKDDDLLWLLDGTINSAPGLPIGNYLSQYFANFYLNYFDHWMKEVKKVKYYFRYADDLVILSDNKEYLHQLLKEITHYLSENLQLTVKKNHQVFPIAVKNGRGLDFVGYVFYHTHVRLRPGIKRNYARKIARGISTASKAAYKGWTDHCNAKHLNKKLLAA